MYFLWHKIFWYCIVCVLQPIFINKDEDASSIPGDNQANFPSSAETLHSAQTVGGQSLADEAHPEMVKSSPSQGQEDDNANIDGYDTVGSCCCVCQTLPVFFTLLPCRHACVCRSCVKQLDRCPICRSYIDSYFKIGIENYEDDDDSSEGGEPLTRWQVFNQWANDFFGV